MKARSLAMIAALLLLAGASSGQPLNLAVSFEEDLRYSSVAPADQQLAARNTSNAWSLNVSTLTASLPASANLDAVSYISPTNVYFSLSEDARVGGTLYADEDVIRWNGSSFSIAFDGSANGVPARADLDALELIAEFPIQILCSFDSDARLVVGGSSTLVADEDVVRFLTPSFASIDFDGSAEGIPARCDLTAIGRVTSTQWTLGFDSAGRVGALAFDDADLLLFHSDTSSLDAALFFNAAGHSIPPNAQIDAVESNSSRLNVPPTATPSRTPSRTPSPTPSRTASRTPSITATATTPPGSTLTPSQTPGPSATPSPSPSPSFTPNPPTIVRHPASQIVNVGQDLIFEVEAIEGTTPSAAPPKQIALAYQWFKDGSTMLPGETATTLAINGATTNEQGAYHCAVTGVGGTSSSNPATLTVLDPAQGNDAQFVSHTAPAQFIMGQGLLVGFTMLNNGAPSWSPTQGYSLAVVSDPSGLFPNGNRLTFTDPFQVVPPGSFFDFVGLVQAPATAGLKFATLQMVEENVENFGDTIQLVINVVAPPNAARDWTLYE